MMTAGQDICHYSGGKRLWSDEYVIALEEKLRECEWDIKQALATPMIGELAKSILTQTLEKIRTSNGGVK